MQGFSLDNIIVLLIAVVFLYIVFKFIKGVIKAIIAIILILTLGVSAYNIFVSKKSIGDEVSRYKIDYTYFKDIKDISTDANNTVDYIEANKDVEKNINKLSQLRGEAQILSHSSDLNSFHDKYLESFDAVILGCKGYNTAKQVDDQVKKIDDLKKGLNVNLKDIVWAK